MLEINDVIMRVISCGSISIDMKMLIWIALCFLAKLYFLSANTSIDVNPHNFSYLINNPDLCDSSEDIGLFVWVHSGPANLRRRIALRETWANQKNVPHAVGKVQMVFFLGAIHNITLQNRLVYENELYGDLVQEDYADGYRNLTYKAMSGLKWITRYCHNIKLILKTDDDMVIDTKSLFIHLNHVARYPEKPIVNTILCDVWMNRAVERNKGMKWSVSKNEYRRERYPTYCPGLALLMSPDLVTKLWENSQKVKFFWVDDVFFTGLLVEQLNVTWIQLGSLFHFGGNTLYTNFLELPNNYIFAHVFKYRNDLFYYLWKNMFKTQDLIW